MRFHLGYTPAEVDAMPWWERRMWAETLTDHFRAQSGEGDEVDSGLDPYQRRAAADHANVQVTDDVSVLGITVRTDPAPHTDTEKEQPL